MRLEFQVGIGSAAVVDRLCTLRAYRYRGVARRCLENIAQDVSRCASSMRLSLDGLIVLVPHAHDTLRRKLVQASFIPLGGCVTGHLSCIRMCLPTCPNGLMSREGVS